MHESTINTKVWPKKPQPEIIFVEPSSFRDATATPFRIVRMPGKGLCASRAIYLSLNPSRLSAVKRNESGQPIDTADREQEQQQIDDMMTTVAEWLSAGSELREKAFPDISDIGSFSKSSFSYFLNDTALAAVGECFQCRVVVVAAKKANDVFRPMLPSITLTDAPYTDKPPIYLLVTRLPSTPSSSSPGTRSTASTIYAHADLLLPAPHCAHAFNIPNFPAAPSPLMSLDKINCRFAMPYAIRSVDGEGFFIRSVVKSPRFPTKKFVILAMYARLTDKANVFALCQRVDDHLIELLAVSELEKVPTMMPSPQTTQERWSDEERQLRSALVNWFHGQFQMVSQSAESAFVNHHAKWRGNSFVKWTKLSTVVHDRKMTVADVASLKQLQADEQAMFSTHFDAIVKKMETVPTSPSDSHFQPVSDNMSRSQSDSHSQSPSASETMGRSKFQASSSSRRSLEHRSPHCLNTFNSKLEHLRHKTFTII